MGILAIWSPLKIHCYAFMLFETCWSRLIYTKVSSHRSFVINMYVITMAWRCISSWSFHRSLQRWRIFFISVSRFPLSEVKTTKNKKEIKKKRGKLRLNARKHWEFEGRNRSLSAAVLHVKPSRHNSNLYDSRENHHKEDILMYSVCLQCRKRNKDFIIIYF